MTLSCLEHEIAWRTDLESLRIAVFCAGVSRPFKICNAARRAVASALKLVQVSPAARECVSMLPFGCVIYIPLPPFFTASVAEPSVNTRVHMLEGCCSLSIRSVRTLCSVSVCALFDVIPGTFSISTVLDMSGQHVHG